MLPRHKKVLIIRCLTEGMSLRAVARIADVSRNTVAKLLADAGRACADFQDKALRNLPCQRIQADEIWNFVYAKQKNVPRAKSAPPEAGDVWTWTTICADTKLVPSWRLGDRSGATALDFMDDLKARLASRVQTYHGRAPCLSGGSWGGVRGRRGLRHAGEAVRQGGRRAEPGDALQPVRVYGNQDGDHFERDPDEDHISTSYMERQNLTMRMSIRRFTRLTNAFSKRLEYLSASVAIHFMHYNFCRIHQTPRVTPAMEVGVTARLREIGDIVDLVEAAAPKPNRPASYRKRGEISN